MSLENDMLMESPSKAARGAETLQEANRAIRDLIALSTLPSVWLGANPLRIAESLLAAIDSTICPTVSLIRIVGATQDQTIQLVHKNGEPEKGDYAEILIQAVSNWTEMRDPEEILVFSHPKFGLLQLCYYPLGCEVDSGFVAAGFPGSIPPNALQRTLLNVASNQAIIALKNHALQEKTASVARENARLFEQAQKEIAERKRVERLSGQREKQLALITDTAPVYIAHCDMESRYKFVNPAYARRLGLSPGDCVGKRISEVVGEEAYRSFEDYVKIVRSGKPVEFEIEIPYAAIGTHFMRCSYAPEFDHDGNVVGFVAAITDITSRRKAEEALREADRRKDEFLATLAHELRGPLAPLRLNLDILKRTSDAELLKKASMSMDRQLTHMVRLIDDLLDVSRISLGRIELHFECMDAREVVHQAIEACRPLLDASGHQLVLSLPGEPVYIKADRVRLAQVMGNLLNNACKFTRSKGVITIKAEKRDHRFRICFGDTGVGIPSGKLETIFELFNQVDQTLERSNDGLGIGLTLVRRLVELHKGTVKAHSDGPGCGSEFVITLPLLDIQYLPEWPLSHTPPCSSKKKRILIVEDNEDTAHSLSVLLNLEGHDTWTARDGFQAVQYAEECRPDIILLDIGLPGINGYEACRAIRKKAWAQEVQIIALSGWGQEEDRRKSKKAGFNHHLLKPVDSAVILKIVSEGASISDSAKPTQSPPGFSGIFHEESVGQGPNSGGDE